MGFKILGGLFTGLVTPLIDISAKSSYRSTLHQTSLAGKNGNVFLVAVFQDSFKRRENRIIRVSKKGINISAQ